MNFSFVPPTQVAMRALMLLSGFALSPCLARAATFTVSNTSDSGPGSLRQAMTDANSAPSADAIVFDAAAFAAPRKTITLGGTQLPIVSKNGALSIAAPAAGLILSGNGASRIFQVAIDANLSLSNLTLSNGLGNLSESNTRIGGAIENEGTLRLNGCTLNNNRAEYGGAIYSEVSNPNSLILNNCTLASNTATVAGGGICNFFGATILDSCTIKANTAPAGTGSGVFSAGNASTRTEVRNSIIAESVDSTGNLRSDVDSGSSVNSFQSNGYNLIGSGNATTRGGPNGSNEFVETGDQVTGANFSTRFGVLSENGGPTRTFEIPRQSQSPALNRGNTDLSTDQRGAARPFGSADDIGAFEANYQPSMPTLTAPATVPMNDLLNVSAASQDPENQPVTYTFTLRKGATVLFTVTNTSGRATFDLAATNLENRGDVLTTDVSASDGQVSSQTTSANTTVAEPNSLIVTTLIDNSTNLDGLTSLREAVTYANRFGDTTPEIISFGVSGTITLQNTMPDLNVATSSGPLTIRNTQTSAVTISGGGSLRFFVLFGATDLTLDGLTLTAFNGSALTNYGLLKISNCTLSNSQSSNNEGGAILNDESGNLVMTGCTLFGNTANGGGAVDNRGTATISNCTFSGNTGNYNGGAILNDKTLTLISSTLSGNSAQKGGGIASGPNGPATLTLKNNLIVGNSAPTGINVSGVFSDGGNNRMTGTAAESGLQTDSNGAPVLADNGGPTKTIALLPSSPAINAGDTDLAFDQRGVARPQAGADDIGAFEAVPLAINGAIISEFRFSGPNGAADEFIEIYNQTNTSLNVSSWSIAAGQVSIAVPANFKPIPPYGRLLLTGSGYSLSNLGGTNAATGDVPYTGDVALGSTLTLSNSAGTAVDVVSAAGLAPLSPTDDYSYVRRMDGAGGASQDTNSDTADFNLVDVQSTLGPNNTTGVSSNLLRLGAPGPQNLGSPTTANQLIKFTQTSITRTGMGNSGTLIVRATVQNLSSRALTALRFRAVGVTAGTATTNTTAADVRLTSSTSSDGVNLPLSLQSPPAQPNGGGLNASVSLSGLPSGGLAPNATVTVEFAFSIVKAGTFRYLLNLEPVTASTP